MALALGKTTFPKEQAIKSADSNRTLETKHFYQETNSMYSSDQQIPSFLAKAIKANVTATAFIGGICLALGQWFIFVYAPEEVTLGIAQKIFYLHIPLAWWGMASFFLVFLFSGSYLLTRNAKWDYLAASAAEIGVLLASSALLAGAFWARSSWGVWWLWDARLVCTLIMCFTYAAYLIIRTLDIPAGKRERIAAVIGIIAFLDVPLVYFSARLWSFIHPPGIELDPDMRLVMWLMVGAFGFYWFSLLSLRYALLKAEAALKKMAVELYSQ